MKLHDLKTAIEAGRNSIGGVQVKVICSPQVKASLEKNVTLYAEENGYRETVEQFAPTLNYNGIGIASVCRAAVETVPELESQGTVFFVVPDDFECNVEFLAGLAKAAIDRASGKDKPKGTAWERNNSHAQQPVMTPPMRGSERLQ